MKLPFQTISMSGKNQLYKHSTPPGAVFICILFSSCHLLAYLFRTACTRGNKLYRIHNVQIADFGVRDFIIDRIGVCFEAI